MLMWQLLLDTTLIRSPLDPKAKNTASSLFCDCWQCLRRVIDFLLLAEGNESIFYTLFIFVIITLHEGMPVIPIIGMI